MDFLPKNKQITRIKAKGIQNVAVTKCGAAYYWPYIDEDGLYHPLPIKMPLPTKLKVKEVSLGYNFAMLLTKDGQVLSFGKDNLAG